MQKSTMTKTLGYAAQNATAPLSPFEFERRELRPHDVKVDILYCGICHSDIHMVKNEWKNTIYPIVPGHEIIGKVSQVGNAVKSFKIQDIVAVGCLVDSCRSCPNCKEDLEQYCDQVPTFTYGAKDRVDGTMTYGGYSANIVVDEKFVLHIPKAFKEYELPGVAPLLCAGITTYSPLRHWNVGKNSKVGVIGMGGLGHMAIKLAHAMGAHVVLFTTSPHKAQEAKKFGAQEIVLSKNEEEVKKHQNTFDLIINTVSVAHQLETQMSLLKRDGTMCLVGLPDKPHADLNPFHLVVKRRNLAGSLIGGVKEIQEMLNFCAKHHILSEIEIIPIQKVNEAYERMLKNDVKYRFVIDMASLQS